MSRKRPLIIALALATTSASLLAVAGRPACRRRLHRVPVGGVERPDPDPGRRGHVEDHPGAGDRPGHRRQRIQLRRVHHRHRVALHPGPQPRGRPGRGRRRDDQRHPAPRAGRRRRHLGPLRREAVRPGDRDRAGGQGQHHRPRPDDQHRPRPALGTRLRVDRRRSVPQRHPRRGRDPGRPVDRDDGPGQALRGLQPGDQQEHLGRQRRRQHRGGAGDLPAGLPGRRPAGRRILDHVLLQLHQRHRRLPEPVPAVHRAAPAVRVHRVRHLRLGRHPLHRRLRQRRPRHGHAGQRRLLRQRARQRHLQRPSQPGHAQLGRHRHPDRDVRVRAVRQARGRIPGPDRHQRRRPGRRAADRRGGHRAAEEQRQRAPAERRQGQLDRGDRRRRVHQPADRGRRQRRRSTPAGPSPRCRASPPPRRAGSPSATTTAPPTARPRQPPPRPASRSCSRTWASPRAAT